MTMRMSELVLPSDVSGGQSTTSNAARVKYGRYLWNVFGFR
ncbi:hypothetical protein POL67_00050 [Polyangium sp. rjm3]|uniref:Uncharacterized protein n=1 Tax=Polyangium mundeleinium TaxID=2995306 RepID=A0ABT5EG01_9BACT|nr:hypothetical protein [Polyangium mundeleinium]MDC0739720.1 hypothetical protein [Polyangium mundeleinium]